ncbi:MAG TPA: gamma-glutamyltransferase family protein [Candidatus Limnocylindrales bacterium]|nr:gamma-glutamyltransferase family protein [Candidatus Limnocylindrales bacterium]
MNDPVLVPAVAAWGARGAVVSPQRLASQAGLGILRAGGSAVDAAIATNAALAVVASHSCGLGGDAFWLIWDPPAKHLQALNGSGRSAAAATLDAARVAAGDARHLPLRGPWSVTVPGAVRSWGDAHARFGRRPWAELLAPAIELAEGFPAGPGWIAAVERSAAIFGPEGDWARVFRPAGRPWERGERVLITGLAGTLRRLAEEGPDVLYSGALAARAATYLTERGAPLRAADLADHRSTWGEPIATDYRGLTSYSHPPNSCGPLALETLAVLGRFPAPPASAFGPQGVTDPAWVHLGLEASRLVLADRDRYLADPEAMAPGALEMLLSPAHADALAERIDPRRAALAPPLDAPRGGGTVYLATADRWGGAVSLIESNYAGFGSGLADPQTGIAYQNRGAFFSLDPASPNVIAPGKRTWHTLTPAMLFRDGRPWVVHGSMGGEIQPQVFAQLVSDLVDGRLDVAAAVAAPRWAADVAGHFGPPSVTRLEPRFAPAVPEGLRARGHEVTFGPPFDSAMGHAHAIEIVPEEGGPDAPDRPDMPNMPDMPYAPDAPDAPPRAFAAATDPRSEGAAAVW